MSFFGPNKKKKPLNRAKIFFPSNMGIEKSVMFMLFSKCGILSLTSSLQKLDPKLRFLGFFAENCGLALTFNRS
jgi:hypothetical protein